MFKISLDYLTLSNSCLIFKIYLLFFLMMGTYKVKPFRLHTLEKHTSDPYKPPNTNRSTNFCAHNVVKGVAFTIFYDSFSSGDFSLLDFSQTFLNLKISSFFLLGIFLCWKGILTRLKKKRRFLTFWRKINPKMSN